MSWFLRTFTGLMIALLILGVGGYFGAQYLLAQLTALPPRPTFPNDNPQYAKKGKKGSAQSDLKIDATKPAEPSKPLPAGAFEGRVTQEIGLILRDGPELSSGQIGGVDYNERLVVLETSADKAWQKVRNASGKEGWVRGGNIEKTSP
jgi:Bacterial SH3 domain